ncbi:MAG: hypothetical protein WC635_05800 [Bacteriovorax sp.]
MKALFLSALFVVMSLGNISMASETIKASTDEREKILELVVGVQQTYSKASELEAKVIEILGGDGMNPTRMYLILNTGYQDSKTFELGIMMYSVKRIVFLDIDTIVINYVQDDLSSEMPVQVNRSITVKVLRNKDGSLSDQIKILK